MGFLFLVLLAGGVVWLVRKNKDEIRYNYKAHHFGVVKKKKRKKMTAVFMTTKDKADGKTNVPMERNANPKDKRKSYFIPRVRTYEKGTYGPKQKEFSLTEKDRKTADRLYETHKENSKGMKQKKKLKDKNRKKAKKRSRYHS